MVGIDYGVVVLNDDGQFKTMCVAAHEIAHTYKTYNLDDVGVCLFSPFFSLGASHDDDPATKCPGPYRFIMNAKTNSYWYGKCSDSAISSFIK